ncbi:MAG: DUF1476 family protein, partial [Methylobacterium sp.]|nr:DUF1476 family protein [Methylobacterium sp.]
DDDVLRKVKKDLDAGGVSVDDAAIRKAMTELLARAIDEIKTGR